MSAPPGWYRWEGERLLLALRVQPRASCDQWVGAGDGCCKVRITASPVDGKANAHLIRFLAKSFGVNSTRVELLGGAHSRTKRFAIDRPGRFPLPELAPAPHPGDGLTPSQDT